MKWNSLERTRVLAYGLMAGDVILAAAMVYRREWANAFATVVWIANVAVWLRLIRHMQEQRERMRAWTLDLMHKLRPQPPQSKSVNPN